MYNRLHRSLRCPALLSLLIFCAVSAIAQESAVQETNAASLKFYQINTPYFKILYPVGFEVQAQRMANTLDRIHEPEAKTMGVSPKKISLVLQSQSAISNAFVTLAPRRSEFYAMPPQNYNFLGTNDWLNLLASHEYRHIVQYQRSITGFNKLAYYLFGQQTLAVLANVAAPQWFWEGDAVATETAFTRSGRGRIPNFNLLMRTNFLEGRTFNYHKQYLRSYKNQIPDHYVLGYHMISYLRKKTDDPQIWEKIVGHSWNIPLIPFRFSSSIRNKTGLYVQPLFREMAASLAAQWKAEADALVITPSTSLIKRTSTAYTNYMYPQTLGDGSVIAQKSGIGDIDQLVVLKDGHDQKVYVQGIVNETGMLSAAGSRVVWNEYRFDPRWQVRTYSVIKGYDVSTGKATVVSTTSRYAGAALSPDGESVVTVETGTDYQTKLVILEYKTGNVIATLPNPENEFVAMPRFTSDGKSIVALNTNTAGKTITRYDVASGKSENLLPRSTENLGYPVPSGKFILYNSPYSNIDNLYALDTETGKRFQITSSKYGAYNPVVSADGKSIIYNNQARDGMDVVTIPFDPAQWKSLENVIVAPGFYEHLVKQEGRPGLFDSVPTKTYATKRYRRASGIFNPHSWGPYFTNTLAQANVGIYSQDVLSTTAINGGYQYDINEKTGTFQAGVSYQGFYPIIDLQAYTGNRKDNFSTYFESKFYWHETGASAGLRLPLILTRSKYFSELTIGNSVALTHLNSFVSNVYKNGVLIQKGHQRLVPIDSAGKYSVLIRENLDDGNLLANHFNVSWYHTLKTSLRDFNPKFAQVFLFDYYNTPFSGDFKGTLWSGRALFYFPGLAKHHSLYFRTAYQSSYDDPSFNTYTFRNTIFKPRGQAYPVDRTFTTLSANYQLPVWYPDIALGPILNIQRIKLNAFFDYGRGEHTNYYYQSQNENQGSPQFSTTNYQSIGAEVTFDTNILRLLQQIELGFRITHVNSLNQLRSPIFIPQNIKSNGVVFEFLIGNIPF